MHQAVSSVDQQHTAAQAPKIASCDLNNSKRPLYDDIRTQYFDLLRRDLRVLVEIPELDVARARGGLEQHKQHMP